MLLTLAIVQTVYFLLTGVWPLVHIRSFMAVTGPKVDLWLVRTVGVLVTCIALALGAAAWRGEVASLPVAMLAIAAATGLAAIDVIYVLNRTIARIYLLDAVVEVLLVIAWIVLLAYNR